MNDLGQRTSLSQSGSAFAAARSVDWGYDSLGQVTKADSTIPGLDRAYKYDLIGNRLFSEISNTQISDPVSANTTAYTANSLNQYTAIDSLTPAYDDDGNATAYPLPAILTANSTLVWDAENRMISSTVGATTTSYQYDAASRRIAKTTNGVATLTIYDAWNPIAIWRADLQSTSSPELKETYLWGTDLSGSMQGAGGVGGLLLITDHSALATFLPTYDGNGNVSEYVDPTGAVAAHYEYDPFGRTTVATGVKAQDFQHRFSTKPLDAETGLYYYGYRYYDPVTGRWPSRDPIGEEGGINLYAFVGNDGVNTWDILGLVDPPSYMEGITDKCKARDAADKNAKNKHDADKAMKQWQKNQGKRKTNFGKNSKKFMKKAAKKAVKFGVKKIPIVGWGLAAEGAYSGYRDSGFWGGVSGALW